MACLAPWCESMHHVTSQTTQLRTGEAVELCHAWVQAVAEGAGIRALFVKGPTLSRQGLRRTRVSSDVDVLVAPGDADRLADALRGRGWEKRDGGLLISNTDHHSQTFVSSSWPCDIDVHVRFPGFLAEPDAVFDVLWKRHSVLAFAHKECAVSDRVSSALILALHSMRSDHRDPRHAVELEGLLAAPFTPAEHQAMGDLAAATGCVEALGDLLEPLGIGARQSAAPIEPEDIRAWRVRTEVASGGLSAYFWLKAFKRVPLREKPRILGGALWPSDQDLALSKSGVPKDHRGMNRYRLARLARGLRSAPGVLVSLWHNR